VRIKGKERGGGESKPMIGGKGILSGTFHFQ